MRAREPDASGMIERDGVQIGWESFGRGTRTVLLLPTWSIIHSRHWKAQVHYLARHYRVITLDGRGNGASSRPVAPEAYRHEEFVADTLAVMDATDTDRAVLVSLSVGAVRALMLAAEYPDRVSAAVFIAPTLALAPPHAVRTVHSFSEPLASSEGWAKYNRHYWREHYPDFLEFFFERMFSEPHSTKQREDCVGWGLETTPEVLIATTAAPGAPDREAILGLAHRVRCPVLVIHGDEDEISPHARGLMLARETCGTMVTLETAGHGPHARDPVRVNALLRDFIDSSTRGAEAEEPRVWRRARSRDRRALFISSPIGLGHARRDVAVARELRRLVPGLSVDWLAQHPVTCVLEAVGEQIHPASAFLASESRHIASEATEHDLHCFQALRRMDEIFIANFMVFHDLVREQPYDLWIGDEAWEVDYYLHENPELKQAPYSWLSDFVGWLPMPDGGELEARLTADYNAEMIEHIARYPHLRDRALFVGNAEDVVPDSFGSGLPLIRDWTEDHFAFTGYITGFDPTSLGARAALRAELGYADDEKVCIVTVGGSGVGTHLLRRVIASFDEAKQRVPALRMIVVAGPRIAPESLPGRRGLEIRSYVHDLYRHLAACDLAIVQGGLATTMELAANGRPFLYFPLEHHFEQQFHVHHRLRRYGAGRRMDFRTSTPTVIADAIAAEIGRDVVYHPVETDGARRAAERIAELL